MQQTITVRASKTYDIEVGWRTLKDAGQRIRGLAGNPAVAIVTDDTVNHLHSGALEESLASAGLSFVKMVIPHGEQSKNAENYLRILNFLAASHITRSDAVVALGGGVVGDIAGFAAATYLRGARLVQIPTTALAMVDSSVGGKTAIDLEAGKNLAGAFCQPDLVLCDIAALETLPEETFNDGCAEVVKYAVLSDSGLLGLLRDCRMQSGDEKRRTVTRIIETSIKIKRDVVEADERDSGVRQTLNLGHTIGHAVERLSGYRVSHGKAVAIGLAEIARVAEKRGDCEPGVADAIVEALDGLKLPSRNPFSLPEIIPVILSDKKRTADAITLVVPQAMGRCALKKLPISELREYLEI